MYSENDYVLEVMEIELVDESTWRIRGLTFGTIALGDHLHLQNFQHSAHFKPLKIIVFGREVPEVERGYYVEINALKH